MMVWAATRLRSHDRPSRDGGGSLDDARLDATAADLARHDVVTRGPDQFLAGQVRDPLTDLDESTHARVARSREEPDAVAVEVDVPGLPFFATEHEESNTQLGRGEGDDAELPTC